MRMSCCVNQSGQELTQDSKPLYTVTVLIITLSNPEYSNVVFSLCLPQGSPLCYLSPVATTRTFLLYTPSV